MIHGNKITAITYFSHFNRKERNMEDFELKKKVMANIRNYELYLEHKDRILKLSEELSKETFLLHQCQSVFDNQTEVVSFIPNTISSHAMDKISKKIEILSRESIIIKDVVERLNLFKPSNLECFVLNMILVAIKLGSFSIVSSKNVLNSYECKYKCKVDGFSTNNKHVIFECAVEGKTVKTGFFNWISNEGKYL